MVGLYSVVTMTVDKVNYLNIVLVAISCVLAYLLPFELFLFSYVVLGPLHYLTEINWLHKRKYFTNDPTDFKGILLIGLLLIVCYFIDRSTQWGFTSGFIEQYISLQQLSYWARTWVANFIVMAFVAALSMVFFKETLSKVAFTLLVTGGVLLVGALRPSLMIFAVLLPTVIHVSIFMALFIIYGAIKGNSISGYLSFIVFVIGMVLCFVYVPIDQAYQISDSLLGKYLSTDLKSMNEVLLSFWGELEPGIETLLYSKKGIAIQRFIAFTYTYHYLNWFSKTHVIQWHQVSRSNLLWIGVLWFVAVSVYLYDLVLGISVLFLLSMLHVFLELPLNFRTLIGIGQKLSGKTVK